MGPRAWLKVSGPMNANQPCPVPASSIECVERMVCRANEWSDNLPRPSASSRTLLGSSRRWMMPTLCSAARPITTSCDKCSMRLRGRNGSGGPLLLGEALTSEGHPCGSNCSRASRLVQHSSATTKRGRTVRLTPRMRTTLGWFRPLSCCMSFMSACMLRHLGWDGGGRGMYFIERLHALMHSLTGQ